jgi:hypothetical protein
MKLKAIFPAVLLVFALTARAADKNPADYPIKLVILETHTDTNRWGVHGTGRGRINNGGQVNGIEFHYDCDEKLGVSYGGEFFAAKWKKEPDVLTVLSHGMGGDTHMNTCDLTVNVHDFIYVTRNGHLTTIPQREWAGKHPNGGEHNAEDDAPPQQ